MSTILAPFRAPSDSPHANGTAPPVEAGEMTVTPEMAAQWANANTKNRPVRNSRVNRFARDMAAGNWTLNGETIKIATDGTIIDGQHRIYACIESGVSFRSFVIAGLPPEVQDTVDAGAARTMADQFGLHGEAHAALLAAITRWAFMWLRGARNRARSDVDPTHAEMLALLEAEPRLREATEFAEHARHEFRSVRGSVYGLAWLLFHGSDHLAAEVFLEKVVTGADCPKGHPALAFRHRMFRAVETGERLNQHEQLMYFIMAWNAFKEDRTLSVLAPARAGKFPEPK